MSVLGFEVDEHGIGHKQGIPAVIRIVPKHEYRQVWIEVFHLYGDAELEKIGTACGVIEASPDGLEKALRSAEADAAVILRRYFGSVTDHLNMWEQDTYYSEAS